MPRKSEWLHRLEEIRSVLERWPETVLDRAAMEALFQVSGRQATRLLHRWGAVRIGGALVIGSAELRECLARLEQEDDTVYEFRRRDRLHAELDKLRWQVRSRRVVIPAAPVSLLEDLPPEIQLEPGVLHIRFATPVELLERLMRLAKAIALDWESFERQAGSFKNSGRAEPAAG